MIDQLGGYSIFEDKGEVKRLIQSLIQQEDPRVAIDSLRKMDFSYVITFSKMKRRKEVELNQAEIDASWNWRNGTIDEILQKRVKDAITEL